LKTFVNRNSFNGLAAVGLVLTGVVFATGGAAYATGRAVPDAVLVNGKIFTSSAAHLYVEALAIRGDRIIAIGTSSEIQTLSGPHTKTYDLQGHTVIPGINDAHYHLYVDPGNALELESGNPTLKELGDAIIAKDGTAPRGLTIYGYAGPTAYLDSALNRDYLDKLVSDRPVAIFTVSGHAVILNSAALEEFGIRDGDKDPVGGKYERDQDGRLNGVLREYAALNVERKLADTTSETDAVQQLRSTLADFAKFGITSVQDMSAAIAPERCMNLLEKVPSPLRIRIVRMPGSTARRRDSEEGVLLLGRKSGLVTISGSKWLLDGTALEGTFAARDTQATLFADIREAQKSNSVSTGLDQFLATQELIFSPRQMSAMLNESLRANTQLIVHVNGYPAAIAMLDAMQKSGGVTTWASRRIRFEHGEGLTPGVLPRLGAMGIIVVENPTHLAHHLKLARSQLLKSILDAGIPLALGSDSGGPVNPYRDIMLASTHPDRPDEAITREQAVIAYTLTSSYAEFAEHEKGSLVPGKLADIAVLSQDIFTVPKDDLPKTVAILTMVGGKVIYDGRPVTNNDR
jgi:predicted amidohydrolase YtcJ